MGASVMTCTLLWAAISAAYLLYCINGETTVNEPQMVPHQWRRHLQQQVQCVDNICGSL